MQLRLDVEDDDCDMDDCFVWYKGQPFTGVLFDLYNDGNIREEEEYQNGLPNGVCQEYYPNGQLKKKKFSINGRAEGKIIEMHENGVLKEERYIEFGFVLSSKKWDQDGKLIESEELDPDSHIYSYIEECRKNRKQDNERPQEP